MASLNCQYLSQAKAPAVRMMRTRIGAQLSGFEMELVREIQHGDTPFDTDDDVWHGEDDRQDEVDVVNYFANLCAVYMDGVSSDDEQNQEDAASCETDEQDDEDVVGHFAAINSVYEEGEFESEYQRGECEYALGDAGGCELEWGQMATAIAPGTSTANTKAIAVKTPTTIIPVPDDDPQPQQATEDTEYAALHEVGGGGDVGLMASMVEMGENNEWGGGSRDAQMVEMGENDVSDSNINNNNNNNNNNNSKDGGDNVMVETGENDDN
ncbi:hypothetical protein CBR_g1088 [Chara braunii]|uniref:Uncharacterized protein n=1 Tax=Chara braunii TaxID=69332 RepID=A0A388KD45_CHABU|nr:hypothetical protein CBR_g1088 [Chara braunii]|eukprot:GBG67969.1 hypothetical protein CBR_g1088 [Chara braunii]